MKTLLLMSLLSLSSFTWSRVVEIVNYADATQELSTADFVVFDIDNTILHPAQTLGSDQWFEYIFKKHEKEIGKEAALILALKEWSEVQRLTKVELTQRSLPGIIRKLQTRGIPVMALSARPLDLMQASIKQLKSVGIDLSKNPPVRGILHPKAEHATLYKDGILLVGAENNKGLVLKSFLNQIKLSPKNFIFFDDKVKHVNNMEKVFADSANYVGFRYGQMDAWVASFDAALAEEAYEYFLLTGEILVI